MTNIKHKHSVFDIFIKLGSFEKLTLAIVASVIVFTGTFILYNLNKKIFVEIPRSGGMHTEGIIGTPRFINPLLAISQADKDLSSLVYAGLMTRNANGDLIPEMAESYSISEDGTVYTFTLKKGLTFHDETPFTAKDVIFTVKQAANASIRSPLFSNWDGVQVEQIDDYTIKFTLPKPYVPFIENTTIGILPSHIWNELSAEEFSFSQFNINPIGSGPYKIETIRRDKSGIPIKYKLTKFEKYTLGTPNINTIEFSLYNNEDSMLNAFSKGEINAINSISPTKMEKFLNENKKENTTILRTPLLRTFGIFFNHNRQPIFLLDEVRTALNIATPKKAIVGEVLKGYGTIINGPLPINIDASAITTENTDAEKGAKEKQNDVKPVNHIEQARLILEKAGWEKDETGIYTLKKEDKTQKLSISLTTVNTPELVQTAKRIAKSWRDVGMEVELKIFDATDLTQSVIRSRRFDALLFGMVTGHEQDLYAFWHSSQRNDPGLNIGQYADIEADSLLEKMRSEKDLTKRKKLYTDFTKLIQKQNPAIFLYSPDFIYMINDNVKNISIHPMTNPSERFDTVQNWHTQTDHVWPFVSKFLKK